MNEEMNSTPEVSLWGTALATKRVYFDHFGRLTGGKTHPIHRTAFIDSGLLTIYHMYSSEVAVCMCIWYMSLQYNQPCTTTIADQW